MRQPKERPPTSPAEPVGFERLLADLSARFVKAPSADLDDQIVDAQREICLALGLDRSALGQPDASGNPLVTHAWETPGSEPAPIGPVAHLAPWLAREINAGRTVAVGSVDDLPPDAALDRQLFVRARAKSGLFLPLLVAGKVVGMLSFATVRCERQWSEDLVGRLQLVADIFAGALARRTAEEALRDALRSVEAMKERLHAENVSLRDDLRELEGDRQIFGRSRALRAVLEYVEQVAPTDSTVLLLGETGTGKGIIAAAIHSLSPRRGRRMVQVNCAAIPSALVESELFGREKGAYTGALSRQAGRFEAADGSTLFLDEIGELPQDVQLKLLHVLQEKQVERLGSSRSIDVDVRIVAATNLDLEEAVAARRFREDLYYRLNVFPIHVPPLRDRAEDIPLLVRVFADEFAKAMGKTITSIAQSNLDALQRYPWPGNIRELRNVIERAVILTRGPKLHVEIPAAHGSTTTGPLALEAVERAHILRVLQQSEWRIDGKGGAAELLGLKRTTLQNRLKKLGITRPGS